MRSHQTSAPLLRQLWGDHKRFLLGLAEPFPESSPGRSQTSKQNHLLYSPTSTIHGPSPHDIWDILNLDELCLILVSREATKPLSQRFTPISPRVFLQMLATYLLINCTANMRPTSTPAPQSEAPWEQCLPIGSLSTGGFSRLKCSNKLKYSYQKLNIWKPKSPWYKQAALPTQS